jgi:DNA-binding transcriptional ArsR family regulator
LHILFLLSDHEYSVGDLMRELGETPVVVSRHLTILRENNIVHGRRCGKIVRYSLTSEAASQMVKAIAEIYIPRDVDPS